MMITEFVIQNWFWWIIFAGMIIGHVVLVKDPTKFSQYNPVYFTYALVVMVIIFCINNIYTTIVAYSEYSPMQMGVNLTICALIAIELFLSIVQVNANEIGIKLLFGAPGAKVGPGLHITLWPFYTLSKYPSTIQEIRFDVPSIMTIKGKVEGSNVVYSPTELDVIVKLFYFFDKDNLDKTIKNAPGKTEDALADPLISAVSDNVRAQVGRMPWRLLNQEGYKFIQMILSRLVPFDSSIPNYKIEKVKDTPKDEYFTFSMKKLSNATDPDLYLSIDALENSSPFVQFGLKNVSLKIEDINFINENLINAISAEEEARLQAAATIKKADATKYQLEKEGEGAAKAREAMVNVIKDHKDLETLFTLREMAQGTSNTILYQLPSAFENQMKKMLGGNSVGDLSKIFSPENQEMLNKAINAQINKLANK